MSGRLLAMLALITGCDAVFGLGLPGTDAGTIDPRDGGGDDGSLDGPPPPPTCFVEAFDASPLPATWDLYADGGCTSSAGVVPCSASQASGQLAIYVNSLLGYAGAARPAVDFTGAVAEVESVPLSSLQPGTNAYLQIALDPSLGIRYQIEVDADAGAPLLTGLHIDSGGRLEVFSIPFDPQLHRHWQLAQVIDSGLPVIAFSTRASSTKPWTRRGDAPVVGSLSSVITEVGAGRYAQRIGSGAQTYAFDNFSLCSTSP